MTDETQAVVNKYVYDPFGNILNQVEAISQPFKFVGQFGVMTEPNGFYYMRARYYDPDVGRFISEDPIGFRGGFANLYVYAGNNPIIGVDPFGLDSLLFDGGDLYWLNDERAVLRWYPSTSGPFGRGRLPAGTYNGQNLRTRTMQGMVCPSGGWSLDLIPNFQTDRTDLRIHPDQAPPGTAGCIGVNCSASGQLYNDLRNYFNSGNSSINVDVNYMMNYSASPTNSYSLPGGTNK